MNDKEIRDYLKVYEREVEKKYDDVDLEKIQLPRSEVTLRNGQRIRLLVGEMMKKPQNTGNIKF